MRGLSIPVTPVTAPVISAPPVDAPAPDDPHLPARTGDADIARARRTLAQHRRQRYPHGRSCGWCREAYPCGPRRAAEKVLHVTGVAQVPDVPGLSSRQRRDRGTVSAAQFLLMRAGH